MKTKIVYMAISLIMSAMAGHAAAWSTNLSCFKGASYDGWDCDVMTNAMELGGPQVTLSSGADQVFEWMQAANLVALTITVGNPGGMMTNGGTLRIVLPAVFMCTFKTNSTVSCSGSAAGKVGVGSIADAGRTVRIPVTGNFAAGDTLIVSGLALDLRFAQPATDRLALDLDGNGTWDVLDLYTKELRVSWPGGSYDGWCRDTMSSHGALLFKGTLFGAR